MDGVAGVCTPGDPTMETCNGIDDDCDGVIDDALMGCISPDANLLGDAFVGEDAATLPDAGIDAGLDAGFDGSVPDGGRCADWWCDPNRVNGRAGPGCACGVSGAQGQSRGAWVIGLVVIAALAARRRGRV